MKKNTPGGFTLVETIVAIAIFSLLALGSSYLFNHIFVGSKYRLASQENIDSARAALDIFTNEIRLATYGQDNSFPITLAENSKIIFYTTYRQKSGRPAKIEYYLNNETLYKKVTPPTADFPPIYNETASQTFLIQKKLTKTDEPIFYYFGATNPNEATPLTDPVDLSEIRYIKINLNILKENYRGDDDTFNLSDGVSLRITH